MEPTQKEERKRKKGKSAQAGSHLNGEKQKSSAASIFTKKSTNTDCYETQVVQPDAKFMDILAKEVEIKGLLNATGVNADGMLEITGLESTLEQKPGSSSNA